MRTVIAGTRKSALALTQTEWVMEKLKPYVSTWQMETEKIVTKGDKILHVTLSKVGGKGLFVKEIEQALLDKRVDFAVHSMKDLPGVMPEGLQIAAVTKREDPHDVMVSEKYRTIKELPSGARVGTSSLRRQAQLLALRPDVVVEPVRGNINTRLAKLEDGQFDAILLAAAGMRRMGWNERIQEVISTDMMLPAVGQGALAIQCRTDDIEVRDKLQNLNDESTARCVRAERAFLHAFEGGCHLPIAGYAVEVGDQIRLVGLVTSPDGKTIFKGERLGRDEIEMGQQLALQLKEEGAGALLNDVRKELDK
ncbi:hydroxymethylbilane synthase [Mechercharimyces sp. CAU 1602]|uniref:hydroxymethylbilane synthase n=1 Tax=Mechercharimyces sp. CAU 1602 TaxID=2973933 RepID=UPI002161304F|nr:hydroxymethylbilane synthase [Mechercharimyces sp. CAU 1602]MCS1351460.1 hydroxymethylbilane synthase [Mechercharimyces sp. CAU 1602]